MYFDPNVLSVLGALYKSIKNGPHIERVFLEGSEPMVNMLRTGSEPDTQCPARDNPREVIRRIDNVIDARGRDEGFLWVLQSENIG